MGGILQELLGKYGVSRIKPKRSSAGTLVQQRGSPYGDGYVQSLIPTKHLLAEEGSYFVVTNPTPGTGFAYGSAGTATSFSDTVPFLQVSNLGNANTIDVDHIPSPVIWFDYLKLITVGIPSTTTSLQLAVVVDTDQREATAGTPEMQAPICPHMGLTLAKSLAMVTVFTGSVATIPARSLQARLVARAQLKGSAVALGDEYQLAAGVVDGAAGTYAARCVPFGIGPGQCATFHLWAPGATAAPFTYEMELGYWER